MEIEIQYFKRTVLATISGRIDTANVTEFKDALRRLVEDGHYNIVTELSGVEFMVSRGIRSMAGTLKDCKHKVGDLKIANPSQRMVYELGLAGLENVFAKYDAISAVGSF